MEIPLTHFHTAEHLDRVLKPLIRVFEPLSLISKLLNALQTTHRESIPRIGRRIQLRLKQGRRNG